MSAHCDTIEEITTYLDCPCVIKCAIVCSYTLCPYYMCRANSVRNFPLYKQSSASYDSECCTDCARIVVLPGVT